MTDHNPSSTALGGTARPAAIRVAYAGEIEIARAQFASDAPQLQLVAVADALAQAAQPESGGAFHVAFLDTGSPSVNAAALVTELRRVLPSLPIVLALDPGRDDTARSAWQLGVDDYTVKSPGWLSRLTVRLSLTIARHERAARCEQLKLQEDRLRSIVETAPASLARVARDGTVLAVNAAARSLIGAATNREVLKKPFGTFVSAEDRDRAGRFIEQVSDGNAASLQLAIARVSGESRPVEASAVPLAARGDAPPTALLTFWDRVTPAPTAEATAQPAAAAASTAHHAELERRIAELEEKRRGLESERDALTARVTQAQTDAHAAQTEVRTLAAQLQTAEQRHQTLATERAELQRAIETTRGADEQYRQLVEEHQQLQRVLEETREHQSDAGRLAAAHAESQAKIATLDAECARLTLERNRLAGDADAARSAKQTLEEQVARLQIQADANEALAAECEQLRRSTAMFVAERDELTRSAATIAAERDELRRSIAALASEREELRQSIATLAAECDELRRSGAALIAERDEIHRASATLAAERDEIRRNTTTLAAERDELRRSLEAVTARHATEVALVFADKASVERRLHDTEAALHRQLDEARTAQSRALDDLTAASQRLEAEVQLLTCERDAALRALAQSQEYESAARRWIAQWFQLEQAMQRARTEIQQLIDWPGKAEEGLTASDAPHVPPPSHLTATDSSWH